MKRIFITLIFTVMSAMAAFAGDKTLASFSQKVASSCVTFDYKYAVRGDVPLKGNGSAKVCDNRFVTQGNGLKVYCDGKTRWTIDVNSKEAVIESVDQSFMDVMANPALLVSSVSTSFEEISSGSATFDGKSCHYVTLYPSVSAGITLVKLFFSGDTLKGAEVTARDGTITVFTVSNLKFSPKTTDGFSYDSSKFTSAWVVTDLR